MLDIGVQTGRFSGGPCHKAPWSGYQPRGTSRPAILAFRGPNTVKHTRPHVGKLHLPGVHPSTLDDGKDIRSSRRLYARLQSGVTKRCVNFDGLKQKSRTGQ